MRATVGYKLYKMDILRCRIRIQIYGTTKTSNSYRYQRDHNKIAMVVVVLSTGPQETIGFSYLGATGKQNDIFLFR